jgi:hypothetical protein
MSPILPGLSMTRWRVRHRWDIRARPRSPGQRSEREQLVAGPGIKIKLPAACRVPHRDVNAAACAFVPGAGQYRQVLQEGPQDREDEIAGGGDVADPAGRTAETRSGMPPGVNSAWMFPPRPWAWPEYQRPIWRRGITDCPGDDYHGHAL